MSKNYIRREWANNLAVATSEQELRTEVDTFKERANNLAVLISELSERELCTEVVDTTKEGANNLAVWISERELCTEVDTTKKGANNPKREQII